MNTLSRSVVSRFTIRNFLKKNSFKYISPAFPCLNFFPTKDADIKKMSTAVEHKVYESILFSSSLSPQVLEDFSVVGKEMQLKQAFKVHNEFDKFILLLSHGDTDSLDENKPVLGSISDMSLSGKGLGQALSISGETARYCSSKALMPQLFIVAPQRCAIESALIAFPTFGPESIHEQQWISDPRCTDTITTEQDIQRIKGAFPSISFDQAPKDNTDFLQYIASREERIIVISSTSTWIQSFLSDFSQSSSDLENGQLRVLGINLI